MPEPIVWANASPLATRRPVLGVSTAEVAAGGWPRVRVSGWPVTASTNPATVGKRSSDGLAI
ncbi:MAG TPA: hypothetical protein VK601_13600, partial [Kofleriaceae bacterium]|nr:hypothetical protein [Kofleriaceae bacterium]